MPRKKIAVAGAGASGILSIVMLKEEGMEPVCFEKTDSPGGTWCYRDHSEVGVPSIMPTTVINNSKELGALSTFPPKKEYHNYMKHQCMYEYLLDYAQKNDALKHITYNSEVVEIKRSPDYNETGRWVVGVRNTLDGSVSSDTYDGVLVCVGHINIPKWPSYENQDLFKGKIIHTHSLKEVAEYKDKTVVVVGMGCSGLDAAVDISHRAEQVYLSTRSGAHVFSRVGPRGYPLDYIIFRRYYTALMDCLPINLISWLLETYVVDPRFTSRLYPVEPQWHILSKDPILNDQIFSKLISGHIIQKPDIIKFTEDGVIFDGDSTVTKVDAVIMATGYTWEFPFLEEDISINDGKRFNLYKCIWPLNLKHATLAFIGFFLPFGPGWPLAECQCRWVAQVLAGNQKLPSEKEMVKDIIKRHEINDLRYSPSPKQSVRVDYVQYQDEMSKLIGAKPNLFKLLFTDPQLYWRLLTGPSVPYQYRLQGPHPWDGAREAIMTANERVLYPIKREEVQSVESSFVVYMKKFLTFLLPNT